MNEADRTRLRHMIEAAEQASRFVAGRTRDDLDTDPMLLFALVRAIEIVGEAASQISPSTQQESPAVPWRAIVGMRNRIVHAYWDVDPDILWKTVTERLPALLRQLREILAREEDQGSDD